VASDVAIADRGDGSTPGSIRMAWVLWLAAAVPTFAGLVLLVLNAGVGFERTYGFPGFAALFALSFGSVGAFVVARRPSNRVGLVLAGIGVLAGILAFGNPYAVRGTIVAPGSVPGPEWVAWLIAWSWVPLLWLAGPVLLSIFPDGRTLPGRWRWLPWIGVLTYAPATVLLALAKGPLQNAAIISNPAGVLDVGLDSPLAGVLINGMFIPMVAAVVSLVLRYRRSEREVRQQLKWFTVAAVVLVLVAPLGFTAGVAGQAVFIVAVSGIPVATGIAVLRYGLYEIDTLINRALVYGLLTAILAGLYTASVGLMQRFSRAFSGADSEAAVVLTTVVVVAAFTPIKNRLQRLVDLKFKEDRDPGAKLRAFTDALAARVSALEPELTLRRLLAIAIDVCDSAGGSMVLAHGDREIAVTAGEAASSAPEAGHSEQFMASAGGASLQLELHSARRGALSQRERVAVQAALEVTLSELEPAAAGPSPTPARAATVSG
jgi:hypothetical protein